MPPGGVAPDEAPQFVQFGFDDNAIADGVRFVRELFDGRRNPGGSANPRTFDGTPARFSMYVVTRYIAAQDIDTPEAVRAEWDAVAEAGHEVGLHTHNHPHGSKFATSQWLEEIETCRRWLTGAEPQGLALAANDIVGFRTPYLEHGPPLFPALRSAGVVYDCSIEEGFAEGFHAGNQYWPYRIAPGWGGPDAASRELWEIPSYALEVPPDSECARYGVAPGLRDRLHAVRSYFDPARGIITGFDWNLWVEFGMRRDEVVAVFKYTLDRRLAGNRAPLTFGAHSDLYSDQYSETLPSSAAERRAALEAILDHALSVPEVRVVTARDLLAWVRDPVRLSTGSRHAAP
jgi:peptidoglycan/xylan/chitin deacetylase (PgdA/CDA1 family)